VAAQAPLVVKADETTIEKTLPITNKNVQRLYLKSTFVFITKTFQLLLSNDNYIISRSGLVNIVQALPKPLGIGRVFSLSYPIIPRSSEKAPEPN